MIIELAAGTATGIAMVGVADTCSEKSEQRKERNTNYSKTNPISNTFSRDLIRKTCKS